MGPGSHSHLTTLEPLLSIARSLAQRTGGDVTYHRTLGWSNFVLTLPLATEEQIAAAERDVSTRTGERPTVTVDPLLDAEEEDPVPLEALVSVRTLGARPDPEYTVKF